MMARLTSLTSLTPLAILTSLALLLVSSPSPLAAQQERCEDISEPLCLHASIPYNMTFLPNKFGHKSQSEASEALPEWMSSLPEHSRCRKSALMLVCVTYFPICNVIGMLVPPCRETCEQVRELCADDLRRLDYEWPTELNCNDLPTTEESAICIHPSEADTAEETTALPSAETSTGAAYGSTTGSWRSTAKPRTTTAWRSTAGEAWSTTGTPRSTTPASTPADQANPLASLLSLLSQLPGQSTASSTTTANPTDIPDQVRNILVGYLGRFDRMVKLQEEIMMLQKSKLELEVQLLHRKRWS